MKYLFIIIILITFSCDQEKEVTSTVPLNWSKRLVDLNSKDSLLTGESYLSTYSQIYSMSEHKKQNLTVMTSLRNTSHLDTIYIVSADYYNTEGKVIKEYIKEPIYLAPMETTEIIINELDVSGGTGSNFIFEWKTPPNCPEPIFEGVMSSTRGQLGLSFNTQSKRIK